ncbi:MAG: hypothetical protein JXM69_09840 [Anaerolineae bacterium]|nr:hypothetical protein [Anaerolineae bacterium]
MLLKVISTALVGLLALPTCTTGHPMSPDQAQAIVAAAWHADQHIVWELDWPAAPVGGPLTVETWRVGERYRFEILESVAPALIGETLAFDGQTAWQSNRFDSEPPVRLDSPRLSPVTDAFATIDRLIATPPQTATLETGQTGHGPAQKISLAFANGDRLIFWGDEATQLPVRIIFEVGGKEATLKARSFEALVDPPQALFTLE